MDAEYPTPRADTTEQHPGSLAAIPSLSQLKELQHEAMRAQGREIPQEEPSVVFASERFPSGIPSATQLKALQTQERETPGGTPSGVRNTVEQIQAGARSAAPHPGKPHADAHVEQKPGFMRRFSRMLHPTSGAPAKQSASRQSASLPVAVRETREAKPPQQKPEPVKAAATPEPVKAAATPEPVKAPAAPEPVKAEAQPAPVKETVQPAPVAEPAPAAKQSAPDDPIQAPSTGFSGTDSLFAQLFAAQSAFTASARAAEETAEHARPSSFHAAEPFFIEKPAIPAEPKEPVVFSVVQPAEIASELVPASEEAPAQETAEPEAQAEPETEAAEAPAAEEAPTQETAEPEAQAEPETEVAEAPAAKELSTQETAEPEAAQAEAPEKKVAEKKTSRRRRKNRFRSEKKEQTKLEELTGSVLESLPTAEQIQNSKPKRSRNAAADLPEVPSERQLIRERRRLNYRGDFFKVIRNTAFTLITVSAVAVLVAVLLLPVLRIYGASMTPALYESDIVLSIKGGKFTTGDIVAFYYNNKILVKRVIAQAGDWVNIDKDGTVSINGVVIDEPYVQSKAFGECDIELPYQVPEDRVFVMGDYRDVSIDSRSTAIGPIAKDQVVGRIIYRIWPFDAFGKVE